MAQITNGVRSLLSSPFVYGMVQSLMGAHKSRKKFTADFIKPFPGMKVLDIGCGPADILAYLPSDVEYYGFDISPQYIAHARKRFGERGHFYCEQLSTEDLTRLPEFDLVLAIGLLHHLDDPLAEEVMRLASRALKEGGRLLTIDPCNDRGQNLISRFLISHDRGQNVRDKVSYETLAKAVFQEPQVQVNHTTWIPYTHCIMNCRK